MFNAPVNLSSHSDSSHAATAPTTALAGEIGKPQAQPSKPRSNVRKGEATLREFFAANPDEELSIEDAASKLGVNQKSAGSYLARLKTTGLLERVSVYRLNQGRSE
jgi:Fic family protein